MSPFSATGLARVHQVLASHVERGAVPGVVALIGRYGETHVDAIGTVRPDTIFRISSMTKPVTAVAAMILVEECVLRLDDPVDDLLPELADRKVLTRPDAPLDDTVPAHRPITVRDLLTFRMGTGQVFGSLGATPVAKALTEIGTNGPPKPSAVPPPSEYLRLLGALRSCTSRVTAGCTTPDRMCSACWSHAPAASRSAHSSVSGSSIRSA
jgi:Beta-lactamase